MQDEKTKDNGFYAGGQRKDRADLFFAYKLKRTYDAMHAISRYGLEWEKEIASRYYTVLVDIGKKAELDFSTGTLPPDIMVPPPLLQSYYASINKMGEEIKAHYEQDGTSIKNDVLAKCELIDIKTLDNYLKTIREGRERLTREEREKEEAQKRLFLEKMDNYTTTAGLDFMLVSDIYTFITGIDDLYTFQVIFSSYQLDAKNGESILDFPEIDLTTAFKEILPGILVKLRETQKAAEESKGIETQALPIINEYWTKRAQYSHTKIDRHLFNLLEEAEDGQYNFAVDVSNINDKRQGVEVLINYMLDFSEIEESGLKLTKTINKYDKLVYTAIGSLFTEGQQFVTYSQIYDAMGGSGRPNKTDRAKMEQSIEKMSKTRLTLTNRNENQRYNNYELQEIKDNLLHCRTAKGKYKGQQCDIVEIITEPVLLTFAKKRKQVKAIPKALLQSPGSMSQVNLAIKDYLLEVIIWIKNNYRDSNRILLDTIWKETNITRKDYQADKLQLIKDILQHHTKEKYIKGYLYTGDGFYINPTEEQIAAHKGCELFTQKDA